MGTEEPTRPNNKKNVKTEVCKKKKKAQLTSKYW